MGVFQRAAEIVSANVNNFVDRFEDPETMLRHALREMEAMLASTSAAVARAVAAERLLIRRRDEHAAQVRRWQDRAAKALDSGDEPLARQAIALRLNHAQCVADLERQIATAAETNCKLRTQLELLRQKHSEARTRVTLFSARQATAAAQRSSVTCRALPRSTNLLARVDHYCREVEFAEAEVEAFLELEAVGDATLEAEFERRATDEAIEAELARLRASQTE